MDLGYLAAVVVLGGIILFHEFGHYLLARLNGIAVVEFSVGFGPRLLSWVSQKTGIRYSLKLLPLGGSCAMLGEFGEDEDEKEEVPDVKGVSFFDKGPLAKMAVIAAGPIFNFILAFVFFPGDLILGRNRSCSHRRNLRGNACGDGWTERGRCDHKA